MIDIKEQTFIKYDIETFISIFCVVFKYGDKYLVFEISSRKNQTKELLEFLHKGKKAGWYFVGFNNVRFDAQILQWIIDENRMDITCEEIHEFAQEVINKANLKQFPPYPEYKLDLKQLDLFLINHYNNLARSTSLKWLEFSMNWQKVQDLPYKHDQILTIDTFDPIILYCKNDVDATDEFFGKCQDIIELRFAQHNMEPELNLLNKSDSSVGEKLFLNMMSDKLGIRMNVLKKRQTHHSKIELKDIILPYINFKTDTFNSVLKYFRDAVVTSEEPNFKHVVEYQDIDYIYGVGGLHASASNKIIKPNDDQQITDVDVASYYPNLSIKNGLYPKHLSKQFTVLYEELYNKRKSIPKSNPQNKSLKLLLNSVFGKSGDIYSFLYDRRFLMAITVNGQLLLSMLAERLSFIPSVKVFYCNTDGVSLIHDKDDQTKKQIHEVCKSWEKLTKLELEYAVYSKMILRDVNNYTAIYSDGKVKMKGTFEIDVEYHKNRSQRIVPIAVKRYFVHHVPVEKTIKQHLVHCKNYGDIENQGIFDFCIGKKIKHNQKYSLEKKTNIEPSMHETKEEQKDFIEANGWMEKEQNKWTREGWIKSPLGFTAAYRTSLREVYPEYEIVEHIDDKVLRFYVSTDGLHLNKNYSDGRVEVTVGGSLVNKFMDYYESDEYNIDYDYYIREANKIIYEVDGTNERLAQEAKLERNEKKRLKELEREEKQKTRQEEMFIKYCIEKSPTQNQYNKYALPWLLEKHGQITNIR